jgi:hypothetical protein
MSPTNTDKSSKGHDSKNVALLNSCACLLMQSNKPRQALRVLQRALQRLAGQARSFDETKARRVGHEFVRAQKLLLQVDVPVIATTTPTESKDGCSAAPSSIAAALAPSMVAATSVLSTSSPNDQDNFSTAEATEEDLLQPLEALFYSKAWRIRPFQDSKANSASWSKYVFDTKAALLFNCALIYHRQGLLTGDTHSMQHALELYDLIHHVLVEEKAAAALSCVSHHLMLAVLVNQAHLYSELHHHVQAESTKDLYLILFDWTRQPGRAVEIMNPEESHFFSVVAAFFDCQQLTLAAAA